MANERTNIEKFNYYLREFIGQLKSSFPDLSPIIEINYKDFFQNTSNSLKSDSYLKHFITHANPFAVKIASRDSTMFDNSIELLPHLDFGMIWKMKHMTESSQEASWKYLELLYVIGRSCMTDNHEIQSMIKNFRQGKLLWENTQENVMNKMIEEIRQKKIENPTAFDDKDEDEEEKGAKIPGLLGKLADFDISKVSEMIQNNPLMKEIMTDLQEEFKDIQVDENDENNENKMNDMFNKIESKDMASKIQNVMTKVSKKVRENIETGKFNPQEMQNDLLGSISGMGLNMEDMAKSMGLNLNGAQKQNLNQLKQQNKLDERRERLRRKLEEKNKK
jgi:hypothetical protein